MAKYDGFVWEKHDGLWRFYNPVRKVFYVNKGRYAINGKNVEAGKVHRDPLRGIIQSEYTTKRVREFDQEWYEQDHWAWEEKTGNVYRVRMKDGSQIERKLCGQVDERRHVVQYLVDGDITSRDAYDVTATHRRPPREDWKQVKWCRDYDGKSIMELCLAKPKMTYNEIVNVITNEGGTVDKDGTVHRDN